MATTDTTVTALQALAAAAGSTNGFLKSPSSSSMTAMHDQEMAKELDVAKAMAKELDVTKELEDAERARGSKMTEAERDQWLARRREVHKEVERRRRDTINNGIQELAKIVPDCEKNKGSILHKSVDYIKYLQKTNLAMIEKYREEKEQSRAAICAFEDAINSLRAENTMLKSEMDELRTHLGDDAMKRRKLA